MTSCELVRVAADWLLPARWGGARGSQRSLLHTLPLPPRAARWVGQTHVECAAPCALAVDRIVSIIVLNAAHAARVIMPSLALVHAQ
jgi:hypothetical protein